MLSMRENLSLRLNQQITELKSGSFLQKRQAEELKTLKDAIHIKDHATAKVLAAEMCLDTTSAGRAINTSVGRFFDSAPSDHKTALRKMVEGIYLDILTEENAQRGTETETARVVDFIEGNTEYVKQWVAYFSTGKEQPEQKLLPLVPRANFPTTAPAALGIFETVRLLNELAQLNFGTPRDKDGVKKDLFTQLCLSYQNYLEYAYDAHDRPPNPFMAIRQKHIDTMKTTAEFNPERYLDDKKYHSKEIEEKKLFLEEKISNRINALRSGMVITALSLEKSNYLLKVYRILGRTHFNDPAELKIASIQLLKLQQGKSSSIIDKRRFPKISRFFKPTTTTFDLLSEVLQLIEKAQALINKKAQKKKYEKDKKDEHPRAPSIAK